MPRWLLLGVLSVVALVSAPASAHAEPQLPAGFSKVTLATGLWDPTAFAYAPDGRIFIVEKRGRVAVARPGSQLTKTVIEIPNVAVDGDRGMLGIAVDAAFETNGYLYLLYTYDDDPRPSQLHAPKTARLTRITVAPDDTVVEPETILLGSIGDAPCPLPANDVDCMPSTSNSHSIGTVRADPDGTLWVGNGDGASYSTTDPTALRTYDERSLSGKILHIDRDGNGLPGHPFCPGESNLDLVCTKLYAKGFRNPFRFQLRPGLGPIVGDVGWERTEEVNLIAPGRSYGWPCWEGREMTPGYKDLAACAAHYDTGNPTETPPAYDYSHGGPEGGGAVLVGPSLAGTRYPEEYRSGWIFGDFVQGFLRIAEVEDEQITDVRDFSPEGFDGVDLELTPEGDVAYMRLTDGNFRSGRLERIVHGNAPPPAVAHADPASGHAPLEVAFSADESIDPDGDLVTYAWDFDGNGTQDASGRTVEHLYQDRGLYEARLIVRDARGLQSEDPVQVRVDVTPPVATIEAPAGGSTFRHGTPVQLRGSATDPDEGPLTGDQLAWRILLHHGSHIHIASSGAHGAEQTFIPAGDHDADSSYEILLTATDASGDSDTQRVEIQPATTQLTLASSPPGVPLSYSGLELVAPTSFAAAIGYRTTVSAPAAITRDGVTREFEGWSDGGARLHDIVVPAAASTLTASYSAAPTPAATPPTGGLAGSRARSPRLRLDRVGRRARVLRGRVTDLATAPRIRIALRTARSHGRCRHWHARQGRLGQLGRRCSSGVWMSAAVTAAGPSEWRWQVRLGGALRRGRYVVASRVRNKRGRDLLVAAPARLNIR